MGYKKRIAKVDATLYGGKSLEVLSDDYQINEAYIDAKGQVIMEFENLDDLQRWNKNVRTSVRMAYAWKNKIRRTEQCNFPEGNYKHPLYGNDFDLHLTCYGTSYLYDTDDYALCCDCGDVYYKNEMHLVDDEWVCDSCIEDGYSFCEKCGTYHRDSDMVEMHTRNYGGSDNPYWVCEDCARSIGYCCNACGEWYEEDCMYRGADGELYCVDCYEDRFTACEDCGEVIWRDEAVWIDDCCYCEECARDHEHEGIRSYHDNPRLRKHYLGDEEHTEMFIGTEVETEGKDGDEDTLDERIEITKNYGEDEDCIYQMHDGSLDESGIECITQPMSKAFWDAFDFEGWMKELRGANAISHDSSHCGLHVHLSREWMLTDDRDKQAIYVARMRQFIADNQEWVEKFCRRGANHWCAYSKTFDKYESKPTDKKEREEKHKASGKQGDRYQSVNNTNSATIEFRIFRGTLIPNTYRAAVEFCLRLVDYIITHEDGTETLYDFLHYKPLPESMSSYMAQRHINF